MRFLPSRRSRSESKVWMVDLCHKTNTVKSNLSWSGSDHGWARSARSSPTTSALQNLRSGTPPSCSKFALTSNQPAASTDCTWILVPTLLVLVPAARAQDNAQLKQTDEGPTHRQTQMHRRAGTSMNTRAVELVFRWIASEPEFVRITKHRLHLSLRRTLQIQKASLLIPTECRWSND